MPDHINKKLCSLTAKFLWGGSDKEKSALIYKPLTEGGLNIPEFQSRLSAQKCKRMRSEQGVFRQAFLKDGFDWANERTYYTPFPTQSGSDFVDSCINSWVDALHFLPFDHRSLIWPLLSGDTQCKVKSKCPSVNVTSAPTNQISGVNFLEKITIQKRVNKIVSEMEKTWRVEAHARRKNRFKHLLPVPRKENSLERGNKENLLQEKYWSKRLTDLKEQNDYYWLLIDQILPRPQPFRDRMEKEFSIDWSSIGKLKLFKNRQMQAFIWRSTHGKLYARSNLLRFQYVQDTTCNWCRNPKQSISHVNLFCPPIQSLFTKFEHHYRLHAPLTDSEKEVGFDTNVLRDKLLLKRLNIFRVDSCYIIKYAIADRNGAVQKVLRDWGL
jgi:hypothetical protein